MARILVYNNATNNVESYERGLDQPMPYVTNNTLTVREFRGSSNSNLIWTTKRLMQDWNELRAMWGVPIYVGYAFKRIWQGGHAGMSQHYAGVAMDIGQTLNEATRDRLRALARSSNLFPYVEPKSLTPRWVHIDDRYGTPACTSGGYPRVRQGSRGVYVMVLQDALNYLGYSAGSIDGIFGAGTKAAVQRFQRANGLAADGDVGCVTWQTLVNIF